MTDTETETTPSGLESKVDALAEKVAQLFEMFKGGAWDKGSETGPAADPASMSEEVRRQVEKLHADEARARKEADLDADVADLKQKVNAERPPREYRRATKIMRWDTEADR